MQYQQRAKIYLQEELICWGSRDHYDIDPLIMRIQAGLALRLTVEQAFVAYEGRLHEDYQSDPHTQEIIENWFDGLILTKVDHTSSSITAQMIANRLPYSADRPVITTISPKFFDRNATEVEIEVIGHFPDGGRGSTVELPSGIIEPIELSDHLLRFRVTSRDLPCDGLVGLVVTGKLTIPWTSADERRVNSTFGVTLCALLRPHRRRGFGFLGWGASYP